MATEVESRRKEPGATGREEESLRAEETKEEVDAGVQAAEENHETCVVERRRNRTKKATVTVILALILLVGLGCGFIDAETYEKLQPLLIALSRKENSTLTWRVR